MLSFNIDGNALSILLHGGEIYKIAVGQKLFAVGRGSSTYKMSHGSFKIKEKLLAQTELIVKSVAVSGGGAQIGLSEGQCRIEIIGGNKLYFTFDIHGDYNRMSFDLPATAD